MKTVLSLVLLVAVWSAGTDLIFEKYRSTTCVTNNGTTSCS